MTSYGDISPALAAYSAVRMLKHAMPSLDLSSFAETSQRTVEALQIPCSACSAKAAEGCQSRLSGWVRSSGIHTQRADDAKLATEAVRAMQPEKPMVTFRRPPNT